MTLRSFLLEHSFPRFVVVGTVGFVVDSGLLSILHFVLELNVTLARLISFSAAVTATWHLNRLITFRSTRTSQRFREWTRYTAVALLGGTLNLAIFFELAQGRTLGIFGINLALAFATLCSLTVNYTGSRLLVFTNRQRLD